MGFQELFFILIPLILPKAVFITIGKRVAVNMPALKGDGLSFTKLTSSN